MELIISPTSRKQILKYAQEGFTTFLFGLKDFSVHQSIYLSIKQINSLKKQYPNIKIFISINKMIFNKDINKLKKTLRKLDALSIEGLLFYDLSLIQLTKELNLSFNLVWNQTHMVTNDKTCEYYYEQGIKYAYLSNEITLEEILSIKTSSKINIIMNGFGFPVISHTKRKLLTNYFKYHKESIKNKSYSLLCGNSKYLIKEEKLGTTIYKNTLLNISNIIDDLLKAKIPYLVLDGFNVTPCLFNKVVLTFNQYINNNITLDKLKEMINQVYINDDNFFYKKTIYKVK